MPRPILCDCGDCRRCRHRDWQRRIVIWKHTGCAGPKPKYTHRTSNVISERIAMLRGIESTHDALAKILEVAPHLKKI